MKYRWTMKELKERSDREMMHAILNERLSELNPYSPLRVRLEKVQANLERPDLLAIILKQRKLLPMLIGIDASLDEVIAERLKQ